MSRINQDGIAVLERPANGKISHVTESPLFSTLSKRERLLNAKIAYGNVSNRQFRTIHNVETKDATELNAIKAMSVAGTVFEPMAQHATSNGVPAATVGAVMRAYDLSQDDA